MWVTRLPACRFSPDATASCLQVKTPVRLKYTGHPTERRPPGIPTSLGPLPLCGSSCALNCAIIRSTSAVIPSRASLMATSSSMICCDGASSIHTSPLARLQVTARPQRPRAPRPSAPPRPGPSPRPERRSSRRGHLLRPPRRPPPRPCPAPPHHPYPLR